jgi:hypothetical protein
MADFKSVDITPQIAKTVRPVVSTVKAAVDALGVFTDVTATAVEVVGLILDSSVALRDASSLVDTVKSSITTALDLEVRTAHFIPFSVVEAQRWTQARASIACAVENAIDGRSPRATGLLFLLSNSDLQSLLSASESLASYGGVKVDLDGLVWEDEPQVFDLSCQKVPRPHVQTLRSAIPTLGLLENALSSACSAIQVGRKLGDTTKVIAKSLREQAKSLKEVGDLLGSVKVPSVEVKKISIDAPATEQGVLDYLSNASGAPDSNDYVSWFLIVADDLTILSSIL